MPKGNTSRDHLAYTESRIFANCPLLPRPKYESPAFERLWHVGFHVRSRFEIAGQSLQEILSSSGLRPRLVVVCRQAYPTGLYGRAIEKAALLGAG